MRFLKLARVAEPQERRARRGTGRTPRFGNRKEHADDLDARASAISVQHLRRLATLGVDPRLVLVIEFHSVVDSDEIHRNGMVLLDGSDRSAVVAFSDDPALAVFHERLAAYRGEIPEGQKAPKFGAFFDAVVSIRAYGPQDRISPALASYVARLTEPEQLRLDVRCWHPDNSVLADEWMDECRAAAEAAGGELVTSYKNDAIGILIARVFLPSDRLAEFAEVDVIASIDRLPATDLSIAEFHALSAEQLPEIVPPSPHAPVLGLIDSGVASAHPLIAGTVIAAETLSPYISDGEDRHGHGTMVASLALHGHIPSALRRPRLVPIAKIVSVSVLDGDAAFPDETLWESDLAAAIEYCADQGARVINISLGDPTRPFIPPRQPAVASVVDYLARQRDLVIVVSTGNADPDVYLSTTSDDPTRTYVSDLLHHPEGGIIPPGTAALALTVGGIVSASAAGGFTSREPVERRPFGEVGWPSTVTRRGPGVERAIKPELVAPSGTHGFQPPRRVTDAELGVIGASARHTERLLRYDIGTSYAAPLVSRIALGILGRYPEFSSNLVRALTLLGATPTWNGEELGREDGVLTKSERRFATRQLLGYGQSSLGTALEVTSHRAVLVAEGEIAMDAVHVYELPIPTSFYESGGTRDVDVAVVFDPPTRSQRLDYLGNKIESYLVRDIEINELLEIFSKFADEDSPEEPSSDTDAFAADSDSEDSETDEATDDPASGADAKLPGLRAALGKRLIEFDTSVTERNRSTNQLGRRHFTQRWKQPTSGPTFLVIRSLNRWCDSTLVQPYAIAVSLRRDPEQSEIYAELAAQLEAVVEVEIELETEGELEL